MYYNKSICIFQTVLRTQFTNYYEFELRKSRAVSSIFRKTVIVFGNLWKKMGKLFDIISTMFLTLHERKTKRKIKNL